MQHEHIKHSGDSNAMATSGQVSELIAEVRELRTELTKWQVAMEGRVVTVETQMKDVVGNGQPGRMTKAEEKISSLEGAKNHFYGIAFGAATVVTCVGWVIHEVLK